MKSDLVVVVADGGIEQALRGVLERPRAVGIRDLHRVEYPKLHKLDQGVFSAGHELAALYHSTHEHALIIFDRAWEGSPVETAEEMVQHVEANLHSRWGSNGRCVVIDPELEVWLWSDSPHVARALGWESIPELRHWLQLHNLWIPPAKKPGDPKEAYLRAIREKKIPRSNSTFRELAKNVSFNRCQDPSFAALLQILRDWFPS